MHEVSIAMNLVELACAEVPHLKQGERVTHLHIRVGRWCRVATEALLFAFHQISSGSPIDGATLEIDQTAVRVACHACGKTTVLDEGQPLQCPLCGLLGPEVVSGRELKLIAMEIGRTEGGPSGPQRGG